MIFDHDNYKEEDPTMNQVDLKAEAERAKAYLATNPQPTIKKQKPEIVADTNPELMDGSEARKPKTDFDKLMGTVDRVLSELMVQARDPELNPVNRETLLDKATHIVAKGESIRLIIKELNPQPFANYTWPTSEEAAAYVDGRKSPVHPADPVSPWGGHHSRDPRAVAWYAGRRDMLFLTGLKGEQPKAKEEPQPPTEKIIAHAEYVKKNPYRGMCTWCKDPTKPDPNYHPFGEAGHFAEGVAAYEKRTGKPLEKLERGN